MVAGPVSQVVLHVARGEGGWVNSVLPTTTLNNVLRSYLLVIVSCHVVSLAARCNRTQNVGFKVALLVILAHRLYLRLAGLLLVRIALAPSLHGCFLLPRQ